MKKACLLICMITGITCNLSAQIHKVTIYASFYRLDSRVHYVNYDKLYPDSIKIAVMIDYQKKYQLNRLNTGALILRMNQDGWKLVAIIKDVNFEYLMMKEISLDDAGMAVYLKNLDGLKNDKNDLIPL